eukprot:6235737-Prymnesium_polylepis.1
MEGENATRDDTILVNPVPGLEAGYFTTLHFWDGVQRKDDDEQDLPEASWHWRASWDAVDTNALPVCVDDAGVGQEHVLQRMRLQMHQ